MILTLRLSGMVLLYIKYIAVTNDHEADGTYKIKDLNSLDNDFEIINIQSNKSAIADKSKELIKKDMNKLLRDVFGTLMQEISQYESDPEKLYYFNFTLKEIRLRGKKKGRRRRKNCKRIKWIT